MNKDKMNFFSKDNILILAADEGKKAKKGEGVNAILGLCQELNRFIDKIEACAEAQDITENKQKVEALGEELTKHYEGLIDIAKGGIRSIRKDISPDQGLQDQGGSLGGEGLSDTPQAPTLPSTPSPVR